jgi:5'-3' exonuclease
MHGCFRRLRAHSSKSEETDAASTSGAGCSRVLVRPPAAIDHRFSCNCLAGISSTCRPDTVDFAVFPLSIRATVVRRQSRVATMIIHLVDGTYELFRHFYGIRRFHDGEDPPFGAVIGVLHTVLELIERGATHVGVATDHVIESFRNGVWPGYKTGYGIEPALLAQFHPLEEALAAMGVAVWPMVDLEADDALASAARIAFADGRVERVCIWTPDKDLAQCVRTDRVVQVDRRAQRVRDADGVREKFGVDPSLIPDFLALVGDAADGYPGIPRIGRITAARLLNRHGVIEGFPAEVLGDSRDLALLFKDLATLRADAPLFGDVEELRWRGPTSVFAAYVERMGDERLLRRSLAAPISEGSYEP